MATAYEPVDGIEAARNIAILRAEEAAAESKADAERNSAGWIALAFVAGVFLLALAAVALL
jgi:hypothetical protein